MQHFLPSQLRLAGSYLLSRDIPKRILYNDMNARLKEEKTAERKRQLAGGVHDLVQAQAVIPVFGGGEC